MNKRLQTVSLLFSLLSASYTGSGQKNRVYVNTHRLFYFSGEAARSSSPGVELKASTFYVTPSVGYSRLIKPDLGLGLEAGYTSSRYPQKDGYHIDDNISLIEQTVTAKIFYIAPFVLEEFDMGKYKLILSAAAPIEYFHVNDNVVVRSTSYHTSGSDTTLTIDDLKPAKKLDIGIIGGAGLYRKLCSNLYVGAQLGIGLNTTQKLGADTYTQYVYTNGVLTYAYEQAIAHKRFFAVSLYTRPVISIFYNF